MKSQTRGKGAHGEVERKGWSSKERGLWIESSWNALYTRMKWSENKINWLKRKIPNKIKWNFLSCFNGEEMRKGRVAQSHPLTNMAEHSPYTVRGELEDRVLCYSHQGPYCGQRRKAPALTSVCKPLLRLQEVGQHWSVTTDLPLKISVVFLTRGSLFMFASRGHRHGVLYLLKFSGATQHCSADLTLSTLDRAHKSRLLVLLAPNSRNLLCPLFIIGL